MIGKVKSKVIVIVGPTASGKTSASIELAKKINGEIISADSMQIYQEMNIGTAKPTKEEMDGVNHYLLDFVSPEENFNVTMYKEKAEKAIEEILSKGKVPIVVGGTGLYVSTLIHGIEFSEVPENLKYREELETLAKERGIDFLHEKLKKVDPISAINIDKNNVRRVIRALEIHKMTGKTKTELDTISQKEVRYHYVIYGIETPRDVLYERINARVDKMLDDGLVQEVKYLYSNYHISKTAMQGLGYKEVIAYLDQKITYDEMVEMIKQQSRRYAKRQLTWFRREKSIKWCSLEEIVSTIINDGG